MEFFLYIYIYIYIYGENRIGQKEKKVTTTENEENIGYEEYHKRMIEEGSRVINCRAQTIRTSSRQNKANIMRSKDFYGRNNPG
jgi:hypothetical protein